MPFKAIYTINCEKEGVIKAERSNKPATILKKILRKEKIHFFPFIFEKGFCHKKKPFVSYDMPVRNLISKQMFILRVTFDQDSNFTMFCHADDNLRITMPCGCKLDPYTKQFSKCEQCEHLEFETTDKGVVFKNVFSCASLDLHIPKGKELETISETNPCITVYASIKTSDVFIPFHKFGCMLGKNHENSVWLFGCGCISVWNRKYLQFAELMHIIDFCRGKIVHGFASSDRTDSLFNYLDQVMKAGYTPDLSILRQFIEQHASQIKQRIPKSKLCTLNRRLKKLAKYLV